MSIPPSEGEPINPSGASASPTPNLSRTFWSSHRALRQTIIRRCTDVQHLTAIPLTIFLTIHLAAPAVIPFIGAEGANGVMMLGRELYKTPLTEPLLFLSLGLHLSSGVLKRLLLLPARPPSLAHMLGYPLVALLVVHLDANRFSIGPPVLAGASFEYVRAGIRHWPVRAGMVYVLVAGAAGLHALGAGWAAWRRRFPLKVQEGKEEGGAALRKKRDERQRMWTIAVQAALAWCGVVSLVFLVCEPEPPAWRTAQYLEAWMRSVFYG